MDSYLGMDFGGTKLLIGEVNQRGELLGCKRYKTCLTDQRKMAEQLHSSLLDYLKTEEIKGTIKGAGLGIVGISDYRTGKWISATHQEGEGIPLGDMLSRMLKVPVGIDNDVKSATCGEMLWGCGKDCSDFIYINAGTGLAAGIVSDGRLIRGVSNDAGEIGHFVTDRKSSRQCICGRYGCAELTASGIGLHKMAEERISDASTGLKKVPRGERYQASEIFELAAQGDEFCLELTRESAKALACTVMNLVRVSDPELVILGGGLLSDTGFFELMKEYLHPVTMRHVKRGVLRSGFDPAYAGVIGAAAVGYQKVRES